MPIDMYWFDSFDQTHAPITLLFEIILNQKKQRQIELPDPKKSTGLFVRRKLKTEDDRSPGEVLSTSRRRGVATRLPDSQGRPGGRLTLVG